MPLRAETAFILSSLDESTLAEFPEELDPCVDEALVDPEVIDLILAYEELMDDEDFVLGMLDTLGDEFPEALIDVLADEQVLAAVDDEDPDTADEVTELILDLTLGDEDEEVDPDALGDVLDALDETDPDLVDNILDDIGETDPDMLDELLDPDEIEEVEIDELGRRGRKKRSKRKTRRKKKKSFRSRLKKASRRVRKRVRKAVKKTKRRVKKTFKRTTKKIRGVIRRTRTAVRRRVKKIKTRIRRTVRKVVKKVRKAKGRIVQRISRTVMKTGPITGTRVREMPPRTRQKVAEKIQKVTVPAAVASSDPTPVPGIVTPKPETGLPQVPVPLPGIEIPEVKVPGAHTIEFQELIPGIKPLAVPMLIPGFEKLPLLPGWTIKDAEGAVVNEGMRIPTLPKGLPGIAIPEFLPKFKLSPEEVLGTLDEDEVGVLDTDYDYADEGELEPDFADADILEATILEDTDIGVEALLSPEDLTDEALELDAVNEATDAGGVLVPNGVLEDEELEL